MKSAYKPPEICRKCKDVARCESIQWAYADGYGLSCRVFAGCKRTDKVARKF